MKPKASRSLIPMLLLAATLIVGLNAWAAFGAVGGLLDSERVVEHTWQVILQVEMIMSSAKDAETGIRGYLVTAKEPYLEPYNDARSQIPGEIDKFQALTADNQSQQVRIKEMRQLMQARLAILQSGLDVFRSTNHDLKAVVAHGQGSGKAHMDRLRQVADEMENEERRLLTTRTVQLQTESRHTRYAIALASAIDFLLILLMFRYFSREREMRLAAETAAERLAVARADADDRAEEVHSLNATLEERVAQRTAELETTNRELEAFSYSVSHDLRAPLRTIDGFSLALEEDYASVVDDTGRDYIHRVRTSVQRMGHLIDALLQLSRITRGDIHIETFDISHLAESVAEVLREENPRRILNFEIQPEMQAKGDPRLIGIALQNLMGNAAKFSARNPRTLIEFGWDKEKTAWFVRDNGAGFDMFYSDKLFHAFNRLHGDKDFKGSGIGLATVARVIHRHHGNIWADSKVDNGATFWFTLG